MNDFCYKVFYFNKRNLSVTAADIENLANKVQEKLKEATPKEGYFLI